MANKNAPCDVHFSYHFCQKNFMDFLHRKPKLELDQSYLRGFLKEKNEPSQNCDILE